MAKIELLLLLAYYLIVSPSKADEDYYENYEAYMDQLISDFNGTDLLLTRQTPTDVAIGAAYIAFTTLGLLANGVVIFVIFCGNEITKTVTAIYVVQLAIADCAFLIFLPLFALQNFHNGWLFGSGFCAICQTVKYINYYAGIFFLTAMSIDRYVAVVYSTKSRQIRTISRTLFACVGVWIASILSSLPAMLYSRVENGTNVCRLMFPGYEPYQEITVDLEELNSQDYDYSDSDTDEAVVCKQHNNPTSHNIYEIFRFVIGYLLPFIVITVNYILILVQLRRSEKKLSETNRNSTQTNSIRHKVTMMVVALVICFGVCWLPHQLYTLLMIKGFTGLSSAEECFQIERYFILIGYSNSVFNPLLYTFLGHNFGKRLSDSWKKTRTRIEVGSRMITNGHWRSTTKFQSATASKRYSGLNLSRIPPAKNDQAPFTGCTTVLTEHEKEGKKTALLQIQLLDHPEASCQLQLDANEDDHL